MFIFIEGPDGSGKTTLARSISQKTGWPIIHMDRPKTEADIQNMFANYMSIARTTQSCIMDRTFYSELIYGPVMRGSSVLTLSQMHELEEAFNNNGGAMTIYCAVQYETIVARCRERGEDYVTNESDMEEICKRYWFLMNRTEHKIPVMHYASGT